MKVTVAVPVYGVEKYIEQCARSLFEQTYSDVEYVFVDDCSPDKSMEILNRVINDYPERLSHIRIIKHNDNKGLAAARNTAVDNCSTDFILHVDSDDYIDLDMIKRMVEEQIRTDADIVSVNMIKEPPKIILSECNYHSSKEMVLALLKQQQKVTVCGRLIRTLLYKKHNIHAEPGINLSEDWQVSPLLAYYADRVAIITEPLYHYYVENETSYTNDFYNSLRPEKIRQYFQVIQILKRFFKDKDDDLYQTILETEIRRICEYLDKSYKLGNSSFYNEVAGLLSDENRHLWYMTGRTDVFSMFMKKNYWRNSLYRKFAQLTMNVSR